MSRVSFAVLNIGWSCTRNDLRSYFAKFGKVHEVKIPMNEVGFNQRMAFVRMSGNEGFSDGVLKDYHLIDGCEVNVQIQEPNLSGNMTNVTTIRKMNSFK